MTRADRATGRHTAHTGDTTPLRAHDYPETVRVRYRDGTTVLAACCGRVLAAQGEYLTCPTCETVYSARLVVLERPA